MDSSQFSLLPPVWDNSMYHSQEDFSMTPRDVTSFGGSNIGHITSPQRKKRVRQLQFSQPGGTQSSIYVPIEKKDDLEGPNYLGGMSQDDVFASQFSQDITNRFGSQLTVREQDDTNIDCGNSNSNISNLCYHNESVSNEGFQATISQVPFIPFNNRPPFDTRLNKENRPKPNSNLVEENKEIVIPPPISNPFQSYTKTFPKIKPLSLWVTSFKERSRYLVDFHQLCQLGIGQSSTVFVARKRLDGLLYAVKKIVNKISTEMDSRTITKEVCALAILQDCPHIIQYYNSWIDDGQLYIQTELCAMGTLDSLVTQTHERVLNNQIAFKRFISRTDSFDISVMGSRVEDSNSHQILSQNQLSQAQKINENSDHMMNESTYLDSNSNMSNNYESNESLQYKQDIERIAWIVLKCIGGAIQHMHKRGKLF
jgi:hypothetical protein